MSSAVKLTFFAAGEGRPEATRLALAIGNIAFQDIGIPFDQWPAHKPSTPFGALPVFEWEGKELAQSNAILRFVGKKTGLYPTDDWEAAQVDQLIETIDDFENKIGRTIGKTGDEFLNARKEIATVDLPFFFSRFNKLIQGPYLLGSEVTIADLKLSASVRRLQSGKLDHIPTDSVNAETYPKVIGLLAAVSEIPQVAKFRAETNRKP